jgi:hypothetical protein
MAILDKSGNKITAQAFAKQALKDHLEKFKLEEAEGYGELKRTEPDKVQGFVDKIMPRLLKPVAPVVK